MDSANIVQQVAQNDPDGAPEKGKGRRVSRTQLINRINFLNFQSESLLAVFKHKRYDSYISLEVIPAACTGHTLRCSWSLKIESREVLSPTFQFSHCIIPDPLKPLKAVPELLTVDEEGLLLRLPEQATEINAREKKRYKAQQTQVRLSQFGAAYSGHLEDFSSKTLKIHVTAEEPVTFDWLRQDAPVEILLETAHGPIYTAQCSISSQRGDNRARSFVLRPLHGNIRRFKPKEFRSNRAKLVPSPSIRFIHPFSKKPISLKVLDISGSGFSVEENAEIAALLPGLMINDMELSLAHSLKMKCKAQVIYANKSGDRVRCGLSIVDMDAKEHVTLLGILQQAMDENAYICNKVDMDELWNFFFETGFIYPGKYEAIQLQKDVYHSTYDRLYNESPHIARHFIYQEDGKILGHMAMLRFFPNTWLIHHHAAKKSESLRAGITVLSQISRYINELHTLASAHLQYVYCFFRPENKFPQRVFGGVSRHIKDSKGCSLDTFAYLHIKRQAPLEPLPEGWELVRAKRHDLRELELYYEHDSAGLMLEAFDLRDPKPTESVTAEYQAAGLKRERSTLALKKNGETRAVIMVVASDLGLNMSDLTNCLTAVVLDQEELPKEVMLRALHSMTRYFQLEEVPALVYPVGYIQKHEVPYEKLYTLWVLNLQFLDPYLKFCQSIFRKF